MKPLSTTVTSLLLGAVWLLVGCQKNGSDAFASGYFEAVETVVSAQANGAILELNVNEGAELAAGEKVGQIDSTQLYLSLLQVRSQRGAVLSRKPDIGSQTASLKAQIAAAQRELQRVEKLAAGNAATSKQVDDVRSQVSVLQKQLVATENQLSISSQTISKESSPLVYQAALLEDQLQKTRVINPVSGTVLVKYAEYGEMAIIGRPLYKIADLHTLILRVYITGSQLAELKLGQSVTVLVEKSGGQKATYPAEVKWISSTAEFTPKTIQTKDERSNQVYAVKINVKNDGFLKIGMYGEIKMRAENENKEDG